MTQPYSIPWSRMGRWLWRNPGSIAADCIEALLIWAAKRMDATLAGFQEGRFAYRLSLRESEHKPKDYSPAQIERAAQGLGFAGQESEAQ